MDGPRVGTYRLISNNGIHRSFGTKVVFGDGRIIRLGRRVGHDEAIRLARAEIAAETPTKAPRAFGRGLGERCPAHRSPVSLIDMEWWSRERGRT